MQNKVSFKYETIENSSYLVATLNKDVKLINYQMQMLVNNDIPNILKMNKKQKNEDIQIYYNITSKISLEQATSRAKIPKQGFLNLIEGIISVYNEIAEYQLVASGLLFDGNHIFVKIGSYEPSFVYVPVNSQEVGIQPLKSFLLELILQSKVEMTNDNFIQVILESLNSETLSIDELKKIVNNYRNEQPLNKNIQEKYPEKVSSVSKPNHDFKPNIEIQDNKVTDEQQPRMETPPNIQKNSKEPIEQNSNNKQKSNKYLFLFLQIVFIGVVGACLFSGILNDKNGKIDFINLFATVMAVGALDFVLARQMFKNIESKKDEINELKTKPQNKPVKNSSIAIPGKGKGDNPQTNSKIAMPDKVENIQQPIQKSKSIPTPKVVSVPKPVQNYEIVNGFGSDDTDILVENTQYDSCLEYYDNGLLCKIKLDRESILVGKLESQVDYVIKNNKISKIHAEFTQRDGEYFVKDYNSTNGTYINDSKQRIVSNTEQQIYNGDKIILANVDFTLKC